MKRYLIAAALALSLAAPLFADSIDDAEAKRRGVPVAQVIAEKQLAAEKTKTAALEKQLADLKKQLADLQAAARTGAGTPAAGAGGGGGGGDAGCGEHGGRRDAGTRARRADDYAGCAWID